MTLRLLYALLFMLFLNSLSAQNTFRSVQNGNWNDESTWFSGGSTGGTEGVDYPSPYDVVYIDHNVDIDATNSGSNFVFENYLYITAGARLQCEIGNATNGFRLEGDGQMHNFGTFNCIANGETVDHNSHSPKEFISTDDSYVICYTGSNIFVGDDWQIRGNCTVYFESGVCANVSDDIECIGTGWFLCGAGDIRIGGDGAGSTLNFSGGAGNSQICTGTNIHRNTGTTSCNTGTLLSNGTASPGPPPSANDDFFTVLYNTATPQDVLHQGTPDASIIIGDTLTLTSAGSNGASNNNSTTQGGTLSINNNGTPDDKTDDYIDYTPATNFSGTDTYTYIITNEVGATSTATVTVFVACNGGTFVEAASTYGLDLGGAKDGGLTWYDFNRDNRLDVLVNTENTTNDSRLYYQQTDGTFSDVTSTHASGLLSNNCRRQAVAGDLNNDGYNDFIRNYYNRVEIYLNKGPSGSPAYSFGNGSQDPNQTITSISGGMNTEAINLLDFDQDGDLDLFIENDTESMEIYRNNGAGSFSRVTPGTGSGQTGFPETTTGVGDYSAVVDWDNDGFVDAAARKTAQEDLWHFNSTTGRFEAITPNIGANTSNKGGITFCDLDQDGDFDFIWSASSGSDNTVIYLQENGVFTFDQNLLNDGGIDECDCADVDNDGDNDIFLGDDAGSSYLFKNNTVNGGALSFTQDNDCINPSADVEGSEFVDIDNNGSMDLYMNIDGASNQLWLNGFNSSNYLVVEPRYKLNDAGNWRAATGANVMLTTCSGDTTMIKGVSGGRGHGSQSPARVHFGLGDGGAGKAYTVIVFYPDVSGTRQTVSKTFVPNLEANQEWIVYQDDADDLNCTDTDGDGQPDIGDLDVDGDGILNTDEMPVTSNPYKDTDGDGTVDYLDSDFAGCGGIVNGVCSAFDKDGDGVPDFLDKDSDNDGIADVIEAGGADANGDGKIDGFDTDTDGDGYPNSVDSDNGGTPLSNPDTDGDGVKNINDLDSDNDGILDLVEGQTTAGFKTLSGVDTDNDGIDDQFDIDCAPCGAITGAAITPTNTGNNGAVDYLEQDSDNDSAPDYTEGFDDDKDGDALNDLISRAATYETANGSPGHYPSTDTDADGIPNWAEDDDSDGIRNYLDSDNATFFRDTDSDGLINLFDTDNNGAASNTPDFDNNGVPDFRDVNSNVWALPVELLSFDAKAQEQAVLLTWRVASETNSDRYEIERIGENEDEFISILKRKSSGNSNEEIVYEDVDNQPLKGVSYYRLVHYDIDGSSSTSYLRSVVFDNTQKGSVSKLFPNPASSRVHIKFEKLEEQLLEVSVFDQLGILVLETQNSISELSNEGISVEELPNGIYTIQIRNKDKFNELHRFIILR